jgi:mannosyltransferase
LFQEHPFNNEAQQGRRYLKKIPGQFLYGSCLVLIFLAAFSLRTKGLSKYDMWFDEIITEGFSHDQPMVIWEKFLHDTPEAGAVRNETSPVARFVTRWKRDFHAPLYYVLVWLWSCVFHGAMALRWMSVVMGVSALGIFYLISRQILGRWEALGALAIMAVSPFHIWYSQEARPYAAISFFSLLAVYCLRDAVKTNKWRWWFAFLFSGIVAILTSYYAIVLLAMAELVFLNKREGHSLFRGGLCLALIGAVFFVLLPMLLFQTDRVYNGMSFWLNPPPLRILLFSPLVLTAGYLAHPWQMAFGLMMCWSLLARGMFVFFREDKEKFTFLFACSCLPVLLIFLASRCGLPIYLDRQLILFSPFFYLFMARGMGSIKGKILKLGSVFLTGVFLIMALVNYYQGTIYCYNDRREDFYPGVHPRKSYGELMRRVFDEFRPGDRIITADRQARIIVFRSQSRSRMSLFLV